MTARIAMGETVPARECRLAALQPGVLGRTDLASVQAPNDQRKQGKAMRIIIVVEDGDDVELAEQIAEDIPHQTFSATGIPIEVRTAQRNG